MSVFLFFFCCHCQPAIFFTILLKYHFLLYLFNVFFKFLPLRAALTCHFSDNALTVLPAHLRFLSVSIATFLYIVQPQACLCKTSHTEESEASPRAVG